MKHKKFLITLVFLSIIGMIFAQSNQNYIRTVTYTKENGSASLEKIEYFNGLGYPVQTVHKGISPDGEDMVSLVEYDDIGRKYRSWLPGQGTGNGDYTDPDVVKQSAQSLYGDNSPYSEPVYDGSPLNRVVERYGPGADWHNNGKAVKIARKINLESGDIRLVCAKYTVSGYNLIKAGNYTKGELLVVETTDEDGNESYKFTDKTGKTLLVRLINDGENHDTYYVYDKFGNLCFVLPPLAVDRLNNGENSEQVLKRYGYVYRYDDYNRMTWKRMPGCEYIEYIYDRADRLIFWRDGELRKNSAWMFSIPDKFGRTVLTGKTSGSNPMGIAVTENNYKNFVVTAQKRENASEGFFGYDIFRNATATTPNGLQALTVNWYDDYDFFKWDNNLSSSTDGIGYNAETGYDTMYGNTANTPTAHKGLLTGSATAMLEVDTYLYSAFYYDCFGRIVQTKSTNHLGGLEKEYVQYDFTGNPLKKMHIHTARGTSAIKEVYVFVYDHAGRLKKTTHKLNDARSATTIAENEYDRAGRLESTSNDITSTISYDYDVRSRLKTIESREFAQGLKYTYGGNISLMHWRNGEANGYTDSYSFTYDNLSRLKKAYHSGNTFALSGIYNEYFEYDKQGNIESLKRYTQNRVIVKASTPSEMDNVTYEHYSNIFPQEQIPRAALSSVLADNLEMDYQGNRLEKVVEKSSYTSTSSDEYFFPPWRPATQTHYQYNANGAMTKDEIKGNTVTYNILNLPQKITASNPIVPYGVTFYSYSADGIKRRVEHYWYDRPIHNPGINDIDTASIGIAVAKIRGLGEAKPSDDQPFDDQPLDDQQSDDEPILLGSKTTDYVGNKIYIDGLLDKILLGNGYIRDNKYHFYLRDHLGNNRVVLQSHTLAVEDPGDITIDPLDEPGTGFEFSVVYPIVVQRINYYPSGVMMPGGLNPEEQKFTYNDKEFDSMHGLNWLDYGARMYDAAIMRWHVVDPLASMYYSISPYVYCLNNPLKYVDPYGEAIYIVTNGEALLASVAMMRQTDLGNSIWEKYSNSTTDDIYITSQNFVGTGVGGIALANAQESNIIENGKINTNCEGCHDHYKNNMSSLNGVDISQSAGRNIHLISLNNKVLSQEGTHNREKFHQGAYSLYHEMDAHVEQDKTNNKELGHFRHGYSDINNVVKTRPGGNARNMIEQLKNIRQNETRRATEEEKQQSGNNHFETKMSPTNMRDNAMSAFHAIIYQMWINMSTPEVVDKL